VQQIYGSFAPTPPIAQIPKASIKTLWGIFSSKPGKYFLGKLCAKVQIVKIPTTYLGLVVGLGLALPPVVPVPVVLPGLEVVLPGLLLVPPGLALVPLGLALVPAGLEVVPAGLEVVPAGLEVVPGVVLSPSLALQADKTTGRAATLRVNKPAQTVLENLENFIVLIPLRIVIAST